MKNLKNTFTLIIVHKLKFIDCITLSGKILIRMNLVFDKMSRLKWSGSSKNIQYQIHIPTTGITFGGSQQLLQLQQLVLI